MKKLLIALAFAAGVAGLQGMALAADTKAPEAKAPEAGSCESKAVDKNGKALAGAAKTSFLKKCEADAGKSSCETKAIDKNGKALAGAAKSSFMKKCEAGGAAAH